MVLSQLKWICILSTFVCLISADSIAIQKRAAGPDARGAVREFFSLLKSKQYSSLYEYLPDEMQQRMSPEQLNRSLSRLESFIRIDRIVIGRIQQRGDYAVVETTIFGSLIRPLTINGDRIEEGRVIAQQYLFKENGHWKITTADNRTRDLFLKSNPEFKTGFKLTPPQISFKRKGKWVPLTNALSGRRRNPPW